MSRATDYGLKLGHEYKLSAEGKLAYPEFADCTVRLVEDDGSSCPYFLVLRNGVEFLGYRLPFHLNRIEQPERTQMLVAFDFESDGCTYHFDHVIPTKYKSLEDFEIDFQITALNAHKAGQEFFRIGSGHNWRTCEYVIDFKNEIVSTPRVITLDQWYEEGEA